MSLKGLMVPIAGDETQLNRALDRAEARLGKYGASVVAQADAQAKAYERIGQGSAFAAREAERYAIAQEAATRRVQAGLGSMLASHSAAMQKIGDSTMAAGHKVSSAGSSMLNIVGPIGLVGGAAAKLAIDFSRAMEQLHTQAGYSQRDVEKLSKAVLALSPKVGSSPDELAAGLFHIASAGLPAAKAMETLKEAAIGAKIGGASLNDTTYALVSIMKTAPKDIHSAADAMGLMNAIVGQGDLHMQDLVSSLSSGVVPAAKGAGLGLRDVGAAMDVLTSRGVPAEVAGTRLQRTFGFLEKSSKSAQTALQEIGISENQLGEDLRKPNGLLVGLEDIKKHLDNSGKSAVEQNRAILTIFGGARSATAAQTLIQNIGDLNKQYDKLPAGAANLKKLDEAWRAVQRTPAQQIAQDEQKVNAALTEMGQKVLPQVLPIVSELKDDVSAVAGAFGELSPWMQKAIVDATLAGTALALLSKPAGALITTFGALEKGVGKFVGVFGTELESTAAPAAAAGAAAGNAYGSAFAVAAERGVAEVSLAGMGAGGKGLGPYVVPGVGKTKVPGFGPRAGVPGLGPTGFSAAEQAAVAEGMMLPPMAGGPGLAARMKGLAGNALKGGVIAGGGYLTAQMLESMIGGRTGHDVGSTVTGASIGAGIGTVIAPGLGTAIGAGLGSVPGVLRALQGGTQGEGLASGALKGTNAAKAAGKAVDDANKAAEKAIYKIEHDATKREEGGGGAFGLEVAHSINSFLGTHIVTEGGAAPLDRSDRAAKREVEEERRARLFGAGKQFGAAHVQEQFAVSSGLGPQAAITGLITDTEKRFQKMPQAFRQGALLSIIAFVKEMESKGKLPPTSVEQLVLSVEKKFPALTRAFGQAGSASVGALNNALKGQKTLTGVESLVNNWRNIFPQLPKIVGLNMSNAVTTFEKTNAVLKTLAHTGPESQRAAYSEIYKKLRDEEIKYFHEGRVGIEGEIHSLTAAQKKNAPAVVAPLETAFHRMVEVIKGEMAAGVKATGQGTREINDILGKELRTLGLGGGGQGPFMEGKNAKFGPAPGGNAGASNPLQPTGTGGSSGFTGLEEVRAAGGWIGSPGERGRDEVPIVVGRGEAIVNHSQQPYVEVGLATSRAMGMQPFGSLHELFSRVTTPHYMASGGIATPRVPMSGAIGAVAQGAVDIEARKANAILAQMQASAPEGTGPAGGVKGVGTFQGITVADWIIPELRYAQAHGWHGHITSGYRPGRDPHTATGASEHQGTQYPHGAVDFGGYLPDPNPNREAFFAATAGYTGPHLIHPLFSGDGGHASGTGHAGGGFAKGSLEQLWIKAGGSKASANMAASIALAESAGNPGSHATHGEDSRGLWQINVGPGANTQYASVNLYDPATNAKIAVKMSGDGHNWGAWSTYKNGAYKQFLGRAAGSSSTGGTATPPTEPKFALTHGGAATVGRLTAAGVGPAAGRQEAQAIGADIGSSLSAGQARWAAQPADLKTSEGAATKLARDQTTLFTDRAKKKYYERELKALQREVKNWAKLRDSYRKFARHAHGKGAKKEALDKAAAYQGKINTAQEEAKTLKGSIYAVETEIIEAGTTVAHDPAEAAAAQAQAQEETLSGDLSAYQAANSKIDAEVRAGVKTEAEGKAAKEANATKALAGGYGALSEEGLLQVKGDLREFSQATQEATSAVEAHTQALKDSAKALNDFLHASEGIAKVENTTLVKAMADLISGQIAGVGFHGRRSNPGDGSAARY